MKAIILLSLLTLASCGKQHYVDPFKDLDQHISHAFSYQYLWPWNQLIKAAGILDDDIFNEPQIVSNPEKTVVNMNVKRFKPEELKIRVKNRNIIVEGKRNAVSDHYMANHFVQRFVLPPGSTQEEVSAVLRDNGVLSITIPKHEVPPPPPEREVPIEVIKPTVTETIEIPEKKTDKPPKKATEVTPKPEATKEPVTEKQAEIAVQKSTEKPLEHLELVEPTTHAGKIRKKELKETKTTKDNEVNKGVGVDNNGLDYALIDSE